MPDTTKPATGPLIMQELVTLAAEVRTIRETQERRERQIRRLSEQVDKFLAAEIDISLTLAQLRELAGVNRDGLTDLRRTVAQLERTVTSALGLHLGSDGLERERNGH